MNRRTYQLLHGSIYSHTHVVFEPLLLAVSTLRPSAFTVYNNSHILNLNGVQRCYNLEEG